MPGLWLWLLLLSIVLLIAFAIVFEFLGSKWYSWFILGLGLVFYFFSIIAYIFRTKECSQHTKTKAEINETVVVTPDVPVASSPVIAPTTPVTNTQLQKPSRRVGMNTDF